MIRRRRLISRAGDDRLLKKSKRLKTLATKVVSPLELIAEIAQ